ncbi:MAG: SPOR domain-containing protein [Polyangia bacterium]
MQDLSRYKKKSHIEIHTRYVSFLLAGSVALVVLVFALGVIVGSGGADDSAACAPPDPLAELDERSGEPPPPETAEPRRSFHETLAAESSAVPTPASLSETRTAAGEGASAARQDLELVEPTREEEPTPDKVSDSETGFYTLQVASFQDQAEASEMVRRLERAGHRSFLVSVYMEERGGRWYRVRVGPFKSRKAAWDYKEDFEEKERLPTFVVKRRSHG